MPAEPFGASGSSVLAATIGMFDRWDRSAVGIPIGDDRAKVRQPAVGPAGDCTSRGEKTGAFFAPAASRRPCHPGRRSAARGVAGDRFSFSPPAFARGKPPLSPALQAGIIRLVEDRAVESTGGSLTTGRALTMPIGRHKRYWRRLSNRQGSCTGSDPCSAP